MDALLSLWPENCELFRVMSSLKKELSIFNSRVGFDHTPVLTNPGPRFRMFRKLMDQFVGAQAMPQHQSAIEAEICGFIQRTFTTDGTADFFKAFKLWVHLLE